MKKIAYIIDNLEIGGAQTMVARLSSNINRRLYSEKIIVLREKTQNEIEKEFADRGLDLVFLGIKNDTTLKGKIKAYLSLSKVLSEFKPDIIHAHLDFFYSLVYCAFHTPKLMVTIHGWPERVISQRFKIIVSSHLLRKKTLIVGCAEAVANSAKTILPKLRVVHVYNPINIAEYKKTFEKDTRNESAFCYIHVGRLSKIKNQEMILESFSKVLEEHPKSTLKIIGNGELLNQLKDIANELGISQNVLFMGQRFDIPHQLSISDVFLLSSISECCPMSIIEAMASGLPVIATDVGGVREIVKDAGICVESRNIEEFQLAMKKIQEDSELRKQLSATALTNVKRFDASIIARDYENLYEGLIDG